MLMQQMTNGYFMIYRQINFFMTLIPAVKRKIVENFRNRSQTESPIRDIINGLMKERRNSSALTIGLRLSCTNPSVSVLWQIPASMLIKPVRYSDHEVACVVNTPSFYTLADCKIHIYIVELSQAGFSQFKGSIILFFIFYLSKYSKPQTMAEQNEFDPGDMKIRYPITTLSDRSLTWTNESFVEDINSNASSEVRNIPWGCCIWNMHWWNNAHTCQ